MDGAVTDATPTLMEIVNQIGGLLGIGGILLVIVKSIIDRRKRSAETKVVTAEAEGLSIGNSKGQIDIYNRIVEDVKKYYSQFNADLEKRVEELEAEVERLKKFEEENKRLHRELEACQRARIAEQKKHRNEIKDMENIAQELRDNIAVLEAELKARKSPDG